MRAVVEPELQPYFRVAPEGDDALAPPADEFTFHCKSCGTGYAFTRDLAVTIVFTQPCALVLDSESRNALLAHARSHRAPRLRLITS